MIETHPTEILVKRGARQVTYLIFSSRSSDVEVYHENQDRLEKAGMTLRDGALYGSKTGIQTFKKIRARRKSYVETACPECGSTNVVIRPAVKNILCNDCGRVSYTVRGDAKVSSLYTAHR